MSVEPVLGPVPGASVRRSVDLPLRLADGTTVPARDRKSVV